MTAPVAGVPALEHEWKAWLSHSGIPVPRGVFVRADGRDPGRLEAARELRPPLVLKAMSPTIVHKTEVGAVRLGIASHDALTVAAQAMLAELWNQGLGPIAGLLVEEMAEPGLELTLGMITDVHFGRLLAFGLGGTRVEALGEIQFFALPLRRFDADTVLASVPWLEAALRRTGTKAVTGLRDVVWRFGGPDGLALDPMLERLEINPLIAGRAGVVAVDARGACR